MRLGFDLRPLLGARGGAGRITIDVAGDAQALGPRESGRIAAPSLEPFERVQRSVAVGEGCVPHDAPEGSRGISMFLVPKFFPKADGSPGARNAPKTSSSDALAASWTS